MMNEIERKKLSRDLDNIAEAFDSDPVMFRTLVREGRARDAIAIIDAMFGINEEAE